ncbi:uncharacterized protein [Littorina saxatilis]|uniref:Uncharacterized protein n=1 Tax=Littorina saxatilis TaxID=31220 RepID=A0AAN9BID1_9CAEN
MRSWALILAVTLTSFMTSCSGQTVDATRQPGTSGSDVVNSVVDIIKANCIFSEDRQFLRRLAYVESLDGTDTDTYKAGYNGGIWKVNEDKFNATTPCASVIRPTCDLIRQNFNIDWTKVTWVDLRKPLYSGLAAVLYLIQRTNNASVPATIPAQEYLWSHYYHFGAARRNFSMVEQVLDYECADDMDLAFILDSSGSITDADFKLSLEFVAKVVEEMNIPSVVRVATLIFESSPTVKFFFNSYSNKSQVLSAIRGIVRSSGGTATALALDLARTELFTTAHGARSTGTKRVAVLVTDGQSDSLVLTTQAANRLQHLSGVTLFSIGVGGYDLAELKAMSSNPKCSHVFTLSQFSEIDSIITEIQRSTCKAHTTLTRNTTFESSKNTTTISTEKPTKNETVVVNVTCGIVDVYVSYTNPNPNPALYAEKYTATDGKPAYLTSTTSSNGQTVYMTVIGTRLPTTADGLRNCTDFKYQVAVEPIEWKVQCCNGHECKDCTPDQLRKDHHIKEVVCDSTPVNFPNPCTPEHLEAGMVIFPFPYDTNSFIKCDYRGDAYVTLCPNSQTFNPSTRTCGYDAPGTRLVRLPSEYPNPCTPAHIEAQYFYFEYTPDKRLFIHCDPWGNAWLEQCPVQEIWSESLLACIDDRPQNAYTTKSPGHTVANPCTKEALAGGRYFFPYPCDHTRFIHCDVAGNFWVQFCPGGTFFDPATYICLVSDTQGGGEGCGE